MPETVVLVGYYCKSCQMFEELDDDELEGVFCTACGCEPDDHREAKVIVNA